MTPHCSDVSEQDDESLPIRKWAILFAPPVVDVGHYFECTA
jgi:hypothetical protein